MSIRERVLIDSSQYFARMIVARVFLFFGSMLVARLLGPATLGMWQALQLALIYGLFLHWGLANGLNREIPFVAGTGDRPTVDHLRNVGFTMTLLNALIIVAVYAIAIAICRGCGVAMPAGLGTVLVLAGCIFVLEQLYQYFEIIIRSDHNFSLLGRLRFYKIVADISAAVVLVAVLGFIGRVWAHCGMFVVILIIGINRFGYRVRFAFDVGTARRLVRIGLPIMLVGLVFTLLTTIDSVMVVRFLGRTALGYYTIGLMAVGFVYLFPLVINEVLYPRMCERYGETREVAALKSLVLEPVLILSHVFPVFLAAVYVVIPLAVSLLLPAYVPGIPAAQVLVLGIFFASVAVTFGNFLNTIDQQRVNLMFQILFFMIAVTADYTAIRSGGGIITVAFVTGIVYLLYFIALTGFIFRNYFGGLRAHALFMARSSAPLAYMIGVVVSLDAFFGTERAVTATAAGIVSVKLLILLAAAALPLYSINRESGIVSYTWSLVHARLARTLRPRAGTGGGQA